MERRSYQSIWSNGLLKRKFSGCTSVKAQIIEIIIGVKANTEKIIYTMPSILKEFKTKIPTIKFNPRPIATLYPIFVNSTGAHEDI